MDYQNKYYKYKAKYFFLKAGEEEEQPNGVDEEQPNGIDEEQNVLDLGDDFYPTLNAETNDYYYLIGGGNEIQSGHRYSNLQDDPGTGHPFLNDFIEGPQQFTSNNLEEAIELFKTYPDKDHFGVSLSICFLNQDTGDIYRAYALLAYNSSLCSEYHSIRRTGLPQSFETELQVVEDRLDLDAKPNVENLGDDFYPILNAEINPYIYLIGGGNEIQSGHRYANLQDESGDHPFINDFIEGPQSFTARDLEEAIELFKTYPDKDDFGVSLSICFINLHKGIVESAYCLLAYDSSICGQYYSRRRTGLPQSFETDLQVVEDSLRLDTEPLPENLTLYVPEFII